MSFLKNKNDIARFEVNTAISVVKVIPNTERFQKKVIYLEVINGKNFITDQAPRIKELIELYQPREVVIDATGVGAGLMDAMTVPSIDYKTGKEYPAYFAFNSDQYLPPEKKTPSEKPMPEYNAIIYSLKANAANNDAIHSNIFAQFANGSVSLLAPERIAKEKLMATKKGQRMDLYTRRKYLLPFEMTSRLVDEMNNLKLRPGTATNQLAVEQISKSTPKDRFSALEYALWRIKYYEDQAMKHKTKHNFSDFLFFSPRKRR